MKGEGRKAQGKGNPRSASGRNAQVKTKRRFEDPISESGSKAQGKGKRPCVENPRSASGRKAQVTTKRRFTDPISKSDIEKMTEEEYIAYRVELIRSRPPPKITGEAPQSPIDMDLSEFPPGTVIETEDFWEGDQIVTKVPRWAREKMRNMFPEGRKLG